MKTIVFTTFFNRPDFLVLQHRLLERFLEDDYELVVISDADTRKTRRQVKKTCERLGLRWHQVPEEIHDRPYLHRSPGDNYRNPNVRHCNSVQWAWDSFFSHHDGPVMILDSDMFLIRPFSVSGALAGRHLAGVFWSTEDMDTGEPKSYLWLALMLLNNTRLKDRDTICFNCGFLPDSASICDSGGWTHLYLTKHRNTLQVASLSYRQGHEFFCPYRYGPPDPPKDDHLTAEEKSRILAEKGFTPAEIELALKKPDTIELLADNHFLHYRAGTNYENYSKQFISRKDGVLMEFFERILS